MKTTLDDNELLRYSRQIMLPGFDVAGQLCLANAHVLLIGAGGLGSPAALYLTAAGLGKLTIVDDDVVDLSNLQRQIVHQERAIGKPKVVSAKAQLDGLNPSCSVVDIQARFKASDWQDRMDQFDVVVDCSDNFETRFDINRLCVLNKVPLVSGAAIRMEGQLAVFDSRDAASPCYECLYSRDGEDNLNCSTNGVLSPLVGVVGAMQALEAIKLISAFGTSSVGKLLLYDALELSWRSMKLSKDEACRCCGENALSTP